MTQNESKNKKESEDPKGGWRRTAATIALSLVLAFAPPLAGWVVPGDSAALVQVVVVLPDRPEGKQER